MIGNPYRVKKYWKKLLKMVKNVWESKLGVVYLHWRELGGGEDHAIKTSYKKLGYVKDISYIYILLTLGTDNIFFKTDLFT